MKLFISWSGERSKAFALALRDWLPLVLHYAEPWLSEADIEAGQRWADAVAKELSACNFGIICITRENLTSPWILFESGALAKSLDGSRVIPLLLDLDFREIAGPLAQFQAKKMERNGLLETVQSINLIAPQPVPEARYLQLFEALWPELEKKVSAIPKTTTPVKQSRSQSEVLEELVGAVRTMESRVRDSSDEPSPNYRRRMRVHPMMLHELRHMISEGPGDPVNILLVASALRDDIPWLYELGMEAYRLVSEGSTVAAREALRKFIRAAVFVRHSPFVQEFGGDSNMLNMMLRELDYFVGEESEFFRKEDGQAKRKRLDKNN